MSNQVNVQEFYY